LREHAKDRCPDHRATVLRHDPRPDDDLTRADAQANKHGARSRELPESKRLLRQLGKL